MSETTINCAKCGKCVPKKPFCGECAAPLAVVNQPTTNQQDNVSTPVQVADSLNIGANESTGAQITDTVKDQPTLQTRATTIGQNEGTTGAKRSSYAEAAQLNLPDERRTNSQQNIEENLNNGQRGPTSMNVTVSSNDGTAVNVDNRVSKATGEKVLNLYEFPSLGN